MQALYCSQVIFEVRTGTLLLTNQYEVLKETHESFSTLKCDEKTLENVYNIELISALVPLLQLLFFLKLLLKTPFCK